MHTVRAEVGLPVDARVQPRLGLGLGGGEAHGVTLVVVTVSSKRYEASSAPATGSSSSSSDSPDDSPPTPTACSSRRWSRFSCRSASFSLRTFSASFCLDICRLSFFRLWKPVMKAARAASSNTISALPLARFFCDPAPRLPIVGRPHRARALAPC